VGDHHATEGDPGHEQGEVLRGASCREGRHEVSFG
jgi:hypothetical protein